ncbi:MAG: DUF262 domain-containing protein [Candidatus Marinimicrobia bacterium]|nr:DUF262 domain-containing protein [Candidatus Neomarinimicrobiota bacterium]
MRNIGKKTSFFEIFDKGNQKVEIPIIQRDYAQGRISEIEVRINFLKSIKKSFESNEPIHLDFIYGSIENNVFIPLDGQQRLTTLFLLHWYLAAREERLEEFNKIFRKDNESRFTYETRISSREFCNALVSNKIEFPKSKDEFISEIIKDSSWYFMSWDNDPTISAMLIMLDSIHNLFFDITDKYDKLIDPGQFISFQFIELKDFGLSDELYIKMNARGKELTYFENFKAKFSKILEQQDNENGTSLKDEFSIKIDTCWTDLFWPFKDPSTNIIDDKIMNLIRVIITNYYSLRDDVDFHVINELTNNKVKYSYYKYEELSCFDEVTNKYIIAYLNCLLGENNVFRYYLEDKGLVDELGIFKNVINHNISYPVRIQFYALYQYLIEGYSKEQLFDWMRVIRNLTENTRIDEIKDYIDALRSVSMLLNQSENILEYLTDNNNEVSGFSTIQVKEERIKAILLLRDDNWREAIIDIENHTYFYGQIGFLLNFSKIEDYFETDHTLNWSVDENDKYFEEFKITIDKAKSVFNENGINDFNDFIFERALLSIGDYLLRKGSNRSFGINGKERDISWKRLLRDNDRSRDYLRVLFSKISSDSVFDDLKTIIQNSDINDWRRYFIEFPELISVCGYNKYIRFNSEKDILLLEKTQTNGRHREYYTYALATRLRKAENSVNYIKGYSVDHFKYIKRINNISVDIKFDYFYDRGRCYKIEYNKEVYFFDDDIEILDFLLKNQIIKTNSTYEGK